MGDYSEAGEDENINLWVAKESEKVLVENRVSASCRVEEGCVKVPVCKKHSNTGG